LKNNSFFALSIQIYTLYLSYKFKTMAKKIKSVQIFIDETFNLKLKQHLLDLEKTGVRKTKAQRIAELAWIGLLHEKIS
jgi:hypothetical protein